jgi:outer membrane protein assembly factor BamB
VVLGGFDCLSASEPVGKLWAYNTSTGALVWSTSGPDFREIDDAVIATSYVITEGLDAIGSVAQVFNLNNGNFVWSTEQGCGIGGHAVVVDLVVISYGCAQEQVTLEGNSLTTGALLWTLPGNWRIQRGDLSGSLGRHLYVTNPSGAAVDLNPLTGQVRYSLNGAGTVLAVDTSRVYATCGSNGLCAYNISTGALEWRNTQLSASLAAEADGVLYLQSGAVLNAATGHTITTRLGKYILGASAIAVGDGRIAVVTVHQVLDLFGLPGY